ncbi:MAG TPA: hypothetical protein VGD11_10805 [Mycobacteriales bacterium]|jgi:hypothetical protein
MTVDDGDTHGRARAITLLSPIKPAGALRTWLTMAAVRQFPSIMGIRKLRSVHFIRWSLLTSIPYNGSPQVPDGLAQPILVWESTFNGVLEPYIEAFTYVVGRQIDQTWAEAYGFPGTRSITALKRYIGALTVPGAYYYAAHPTATVRTILSGLEVAREHRYLVEAARTSSPEEFAAIYHGFLTRRQGDL